MALIRLFALGTAIVVAPAIAFADTPAVASSAPLSAAPSPSAAPAPEAAKSAAEQASSAPSLRTLFDRPHTFAEIEGGIIALPGAPIGGRAGGNTPFGTIGKGDATLLTGVQIFWHADRRFAIGAGARFCPSPTEDSEYGGATELQRSHSRSYLWLGLEGRYYALRSRYFDGWVGAGVGAIVISDRFTTTSGVPVPTSIGIPSVTIATEGLSTGLQAGASYNLSDRWTLGTALRANLWFLPEGRKCSAIGDCATVHGQNVALEYSISVGYRIPM